MKEIKFRGKAKLDGKWVYGYYFETPLTDENSGTNSTAGWFFLSDGKKRYCISQYGVVFEVDPKTVGQYTGLKDKNGKEIYEGDIVGLSIQLKTRVKKLNVIVEWKKGLAGFVPRTLYKKHWEILGNVYENEEMLEFLTN